MIPNTAKIDHISSLLAVHRFPPRDLLSLGPRYQCQTSATPFTLLARSCPDQAVQCMLFLIPLYLMWHPFKSLGAYAQFFIAM